MNALFGISGFIAVAAITPGPNNIVILRTSASRGLIATLPAIGGVVAGGLTLLVLVITGVGTLFEIVPYMKIAIATAGCAYLLWLAVGLIAPTFRDGKTSKPNPSSSLPSGFLGLFAFQFLNPKGWVMILTAVSLTATDTRSYTLLAGLFIVIPTLCLTFWALLGQQVKRLLRRDLIRRWFERTMGLLLIVCAVFLFLEALTQEM